MKKRTYHICFTSHREVLCRAYLDYCMLFNCIAQACLKTDDMLLAFAIMSNHVHIISMNDNPGRFVKMVRSSHTQMFNSRYNRSGKLGDKSFFCSELQGRRHIAAAISYVLRNPIHHGICSNPYAYPFTSIGQYFQKGLGNVQADRVTVCSRRQQLVRGKNYIPAELEFDVHGQLLLDDFVQSSLVEALFGSYSAFQYNLHRRNYAEWKEEQMQDMEKETEPVSVGLIEPYLDKIQIERIENAKPQWMKEKEVSDIELCDLIDREYVPKYGKSSYCQLSSREVASIFDDIMRCRNVSFSQLSRCLANG